MSNLQDRPEIQQEALKDNNLKLIPPDVRDRLVAELEAWLRDREDIQAFSELVIDCQEDALRRISFSKSGEFASAAEILIDHLRNATLMGATTVIEPTTRSSTPWIVALVATASAIFLWVAQAQILSFVLALLAFGSWTTWIHRETVARLQAQQAVPGWLRVMERFRSYLANEG